MVMFALLIYSCFNVWLELRSTAADLRANIVRIERKNEQLFTENSRCSTELTEKDRKLQDFRDKLQEVTARPVQVSVTSAPKAAEPPKVEGMRYSQRRIASPREDAPYAIEITIQVESDVQPVSLVFSTDGTIIEGRHSIVGHSFFMEDKQQYLGAKREKYYMGFGSPALTPKNPLVVVLMSAGPISLTNIERAPFSFQ